MDKRSLFATLPKFMLELAKKKKKIKTVLQQHKSS